MIEIARFVAMVKYETKKIMLMIVVEETLLLTQEQKCVVMEFLKEYRMLDMRCVADRLDMTLEDRCVALVMLLTKQTWRMTVAVETEQ